MLHTVTSWIIWVHEVTILSKLNEGLQHYVCFEHFNVCDHYIITSVESSNTLLTGAQIDETILYQHSWNQYCMVTNVDIFIFIYFSGF